MAILTVRNVPDDVHRALRVWAAEHGRSAEAAVREILADAVQPEKRARVGDALAAIGRGCESLAERAGGEQREGKQVIGAHIGTRSRVCTV